MWSRAENAHAYSGSDPGHAEISRIFITFVTTSAWLLSFTSCLELILSLVWTFVSDSRSLLPPRASLVHNLGLPLARRPCSIMSDDEEFFEWDEEYLFDDPVLDLAVSITPMEV